MPKLLLHTQKTKDQTTIDPQVIDKLNEFIKDAKVGCIEITARRAVKPKSHQQVKTIFGLMFQDTIAQANEQAIDVSCLLKYLLVDRIPKGQGLTKDFLLELAYIICPTVDDEGRRVTLSKMSTVQSSNLFERFRTIVAPLGINIEDPNVNWKTDKEKESKNVKG